MRTRGMFITASAMLGVAAVVYTGRKELRRYIRVERMDRKPELVGKSVTAQGDRAAYGASEDRRRRDREAAGVAPGTPIDTTMPDLRPGDQSG